jgi:hypothetical protein
VSWWMKKNTDISFGRFKNLTKTSSKRNRFIPFNWLYLGELNKQNKKIMMKYIVVIATSLMLSVSVFAGRDDNNEKESKSVSSVEKVNLLQLTGSVVDEKNNEALAGAAIVVENKKYYADLDGNFSIKDVKPGKYKIAVELISYEPVTVEIDLVKNEKLNIGLQQK